MKKLLLTRIASSLLIATAVLFVTVTTAPAQTQIMTVQVIDAANLPVSDLYVRFQASRISSPLLPPVWGTDWLIMRSVGGGLYQIAFNRSPAAINQSWRVAMTVPGVLNSKPAELISKPLSVSCRQYIYKLGLELPTPPEPPGGVVNNNYGGR